MKADPHDLLISVKNLGLERTRVKTIKGFTGLGIKMYPFIFVNSNNNFISR